MHVRAVRFRDHSDMSQLSSIAPAKWSPLLIALVFGAGIWLLLAFSEPSSSSSRSSTAGTTTHSGSSRDLDYATGATLPSGPVSRGAAFSRRYDSPEEQRTTIRSSYVPTGAYSPSKAFQLRAKRHCKYLKKELDIPGSAKVVTERGYGFWWQDHWEPTWACPLVERIMHHAKTARQTSGDGGKWVCDVALMPYGRENCLVYSFGSHGIYTFELGMAAARECEIQTFDPFKLGETPTGKGITAHSWGLAATDYVTEPMPQWQGERKTMRSLSSIYKELGHSGRTIDVLKVDIDGIEFGIFDNETFWTDLRRANIHISQILLEVHFQGISPDRFTPDFKTAAGDNHRLNTGPDIDRLLRMMTAQGYAMFHKEVNLAANDACEYGFVKVDINC